MDNNKPAAYSTENPRNIAPLASSADSEAFTKFQQLVDKWLEVAILERITAFREDIIKLKRH